VITDKRAVSLPNLPSNNPVGYKLIETPPIKNKPKHRRKGEYKEQNGKNHVQEGKINHLRGQTTKGNFRKQ
jgi:hypothetical protein